MDCKLCNKCGLIKPLNEYSFRSDRKTRPRSQCKTCSSTLAKEYRLNNIDKVKQTKKKYRDANFIKISEYNKRYKQVYSELNKVKLLKKKKEYYLNNKEVSYAAAHRRKATKLNATPSFINEEYVKLFFIIAKEEEARLGVKCHVDHIVPLKSKFVCGLHYEHNLQILTINDNLKKNNKYWPDMPNLQDPELIKLAREYYAKTS